MLANRMFFWGAWPSPSEEEAPPTPTARRSNEGGGGYELDEDYWETRERYIKRMLQVTEIRHAQPFRQPTDTLPSQPYRSAVPLPLMGEASDLAESFINTVNAQIDALNAARSAPTRAALKAAGSRIAETSMQLARLRDQYEMETLAILIASTI